jgi:transcriptional regulator with XRE-family HTH domain
MLKEKPQYARNINYLRNRLGLTRKKAAEAAGINTSSWNSYEEGTAFPNYKRMPDICRVLQFNDVLALITKDLANDKKVLEVNKADAISALRQIQEYLKQEIK